uniref:MIF4G domain-containing protein n=1 Tax=Candidozyma auris TaxID=498019 RepID=A0A0L0P5C7_CANAR
MSGKPESQADIPSSLKATTAGAPAAAAAVQPTPAARAPAPSSAPAPSGEAQDAQGHQQAPGQKYPQHGHFGPNSQGKPYNRHNTQQGGSAPGTPQHHHQQVHHHHQGQRNYQKNYYNNAGANANAGANNSGSKQHHQQHHQQRNYAKVGAQQGQYQNYGYPSNMYNYYPMYYPPQMMQAATGAVSVPGSYAPQLPLLSHSPVQTYPAASVSPAGSSKVKITDKDGRQVNLEEKKKLSASSSALTTPVPATAQMVKPQSSESAPATASESAPATNTGASACATPAAAAKKTNAAEEFRKKILAKAKAAKEAKEKQEAEAKAKEKQNEPVAEEAAKKDTPAAEPIAEAVPEKKEEPAIIKTESPELKEVPPKEAEKQAEPVEKAVEPKVEEEPVETSKPAEPASLPEERTPSTDASKTESAPVGVPEGAPAEAKATVAEPEAAHEAEPASTEPADDIEEEDEGVEDAEPENEAGVFDLSSFFDRLQTCKDIEDAFTYPYPYPLTGVDARWRAGKKKYRYDPQFLLQFRESVSYPVDDAWKEKLEGLGIVANKRPGPGGPQRMNSTRFGSGPIPNRMGGPQQGRPGLFDGRQNSRSGSRRRGGSSMGNPRERSTRNRNQSRRGPKEKEEEPPKPAEEVKPLVPSANRWVPRSRQKKTEVKTAPDGTVLLDKEDVERKVKSSLNKLTLEMFEPITEELLTIAKQSRYEEDAATIKQVISLTFAKACDEPYWSAVYAQFCAKMLKEISDDIKDVNTLTKSGEPATGGDLARRILLATCQSEYEKGWVDKLPTNPDGSPLEPEMMSDEYYAMAAAKRRGLGLVKFIGNLYILNMLNDQVILHCLRDQSKNVTDPSEDSLENLAQLIKTVGPRFEASERNKAALNMIFDNIQLILDNCKLSSRIKFMLMDLQDLKKSNWKSLKQESGPKTIKEIHNEAELKRLEESRAQAEKRRNKGGYNSGGYSGGDSRSNSTRGGASWGNKKESRAPTKDSRGFQSVSRSQSNRPTPDSSFNASHMSPRENSKRTDSMASNIFAALDGDNDDMESEGAGH